MFDEIMKLWNCAAFFSVHPVRPGNCAHSRDVKTSLFRQTVKY